MRLVRLAAAVGALALPAVPGARAAPTETVLYSFKGGRDGAVPTTRLLVDASGALYGTTLYGGAWGFGTVFRLAPAGPNDFTKTTLHSFRNGGDGAHPEGGLVADRDGALYGTTEDGGASGCGTVFRLTPTPVGGTRWTKTVLHPFRCGADGATPTGGLIVDPGGALYGTTTGGGKGRGTVFRLTPPAAGRTQWIKTSLFLFAPGGRDGAAPVAGLVADPGGALYGATSYSGAGGQGTVFKLVPPAGGATRWIITTLSSFQGGDDGTAPNAALLADRAGALYGVSRLGGAVGHGTVFKLTPPPPGGGAASWTKTVLKVFQSNRDGQFPMGGLTQGAGGTLYGTTAGYPGATGTVFRLTPPVAGATDWTAKTLHVFGPGDGREPDGGVAQDASGALYGTTAFGGTSDAGTIFKLVP